MVALGLEVHDDLFGLGELIGTKLTVGFVFFQRNRGGRDRPFVSWRTPAARLPRTRLVGISSRRSIGIHTLLHWRT
jgi:hypothetical protein